MSNYVVKRRARRTLSEGGEASLHLLNSPTEEDEATLKAHLLDLNPSERMHQELDEASRSLALLTESLDTEFRRPPPAAAAAAGGRDSLAEVSAAEVKRRSRTLSGKALNRLAISSTLSTSEPGVAVM